MRRQKVVFASERAPYRVSRLRVVFADTLQPTLLLDSGVLCDQYLNERTKQCFTSLADIVHKLEETQVEGQFLL
jgi:hypothetical protein